jgi:hypothetical protein
MIHFLTPCYRSDPKTAAEWNANICRELKLQGCTASILHDYPNIEVARSLLISRFREEKFANYVFLRDDDIDIAPEVVYSMISADAPAVLVPYRLRKKDRFDVVFDESKNLMWGGLGCALIRRDVIDRLWEDYFGELHFYQDGELKVHLFRQMFANVNGTREYMKEDHSFWHRVRTCGFKLLALEGQKITHAGIQSIYPNEVNVNA